MDQVKSNQIRVINLVIDVSLIETQGERYVPST